MQIISVSWELPIYRAVPGCCALIGKLGENASMCDATINQINSDN